MNYGYVKVAAAVPRVKVADCKFNASEIEKEIIIADGKGVQIIAFPELCITGYTCGDLFAQQLLLEEAEMGLIQILNCCTLRRTRFKMRKSVSNSFHRLDKIGQLGLKKAVTVYRFVEIQRLVPPVNERTTDGTKAAVVTD